MEPTLTIGQRVAVAPLVSTPEIGDIAVFHTPKQAEAAQNSPYQAHRRWTGR
jgi:hypothetical protein